MDTFESLFESLDALDWEATEISSSTEPPPPLNDNDERLSYSPDMSGLDEMMNVPSTLSPIREPDAEPPSSPNYEPPSSDDDNVQPPASPNFEPDYEPNSPTCSSSDDDDSKQPKATTKRRDSSDDDDSKQPSTTTKRRGSSDNDDSKQPKAMETTKRRDPITPPGSPQHFEPTSPKAETTKRRGPITPPGSPQHFEPTSPKAETTKRRVPITPPVSPHFKTPRKEPIISAKTPRKEPRLSLKRRISPIRAPAASKKSFIRRIPKDPRRLEEKTSPALKMPKFAAKGSQEIPKDSVKEEVPKPQQQTKRPEEKNVTKIPWKPSHSYKPQYIHSYSHTVNYVLAIREGEYVLTNGFKSQDKTDQERWIDELENDLHYACQYARNLYCVDTITYQWLKKAIDTWSKFHRINYIPIQVWNDSPQLGPCTFCMSTNCVRWLAIRGGVQRFFRYEVDMLLH